MATKSIMGQRGNRSITSPSRARAFEVFKNDLTEDWTKEQKNIEEISDDWLMEISIGESDNVIDDDFYSYNNAA